MSQVSSALSLQKFDAADVDVSPAGSSDSQPRSPFESPDPHQSLVEPVDPQTSLQTSAYEKLSLSQFQSTSDDDKSGDSEGGVSGQSDGAEVGHVSTASIVLDVQPVLGAPDSHQDV